MTSEHFCIWLQGFLELSHDNISLTEKQVRIVKEHLKLVFEKKTEEKQSLLSNLVYDPVGTLLTKINPLAKPGETMSSTTKQKYC